MRWGRELFAAGGRVVGQGAEAARLVQLAFADGSVLEDVAADYIVLFFAAPGVAFPARVTILGPAGDVLAEYDHFTELDYIGC